MAHISTERRITWKQRIIVLAAIVSLTLSLTTFTKAGLDNDIGEYTAEGVYIRSGPGTSYAILGVGYTSHSVCAHYAVAENFSPPGPAWIYHTNRTTGVVGYSHGVYLGYYEGTSC